MAITENIRWARAKLPFLRAQLKRAIGDSKVKHGQWVVARNGSDKEKAAKALQEWKNSVRKAHKLSQTLNAYSQYVNKGAQSASLDVAKAIALWEGGRSKDGMFHPYKDPAGVWTIGYGHTHGVSKNTKPLTGDEATTLLLHDLNTVYAPAVRAAYKRNKWQANQKMFDATTSFVFNLGVGMLQPGHDFSGAMKKRNATATAHAMLLYDKAGIPPQVLPGLLRRRQWESQLFRGGHYSI